MSKRRESKKTAVFVLEPDGFSIHTFELSKKLTRYEYYHMKDVLYSDLKIAIYQEYPGHHYCKSYAKHGVRIYLEHNQSKDGFDSYFVRMVINPHVLIEPGCSYLGYSSKKEIQHEGAEKGLYKVV